MRRVAVIGCGGSGKTTLANELAARLDIPVVHIDSHYWQLVDGKRVESTPEQWKARHRELIAKDEWVIEGMKFGVLDERLARADTVIYLDPPTAVCLGGIIHRLVRHRGRDQPELGVYVRINHEFLRWVSTFRARQRPLLLSKLSTFEGDLVPPPTARSPTLPPDTHALTLPRARAQALQTAQRRAGGPVSEMPVRSPMQVADHPGDEPVVVDRS